jgi:predicted nucleic acid-binding protein
VAAELVESFPSGREFWRLARGETLVEVAVTLSEVHEFGPGEREAINFALEHRERGVLMDDHRPLGEAAHLGLNVLCTPVLTVALATDGSISASEAVATLTRLAAMQTVSPTLISAALAQLGEWLARPPAG